MGFLVGSMRFSIYRGQGRALSLMALMALMLLAAADNEPVIGPLPRDMKVYRIALLPICNPGSSCDPDLPQRLQHAFFKHPLGVASFIRLASEGRAQLFGIATSWIRPKTKQKSLDELVNHSEELINLANNQINIGDFDIFYIYTQVNNRTNQEVSWPPGQLITTESGELYPGVALMINSPIHFKKQVGARTSSILPSTPWAVELLHMIGLKSIAHRLSCTNPSTLSDCHVDYGRDPFSVLGDGERSLMPNWQMRRALSWMNKRDILSISKSGVYYVENDPSQQNPKALEITLPEPLKLNEDTSFDRLYIEQRRDNLFDKTLRSLYQNVDPSQEEAVGTLLYLARSHDGNVTYTIDPQRRSFPNGNVPSRTRLFPTDSFKLFDSGVSIQFVESNARKLTVKIEGL